MANERDFYKNLEAATKEKHDEKSGSQGEGSQSEGAGNEDSKAQESGEQGNQEDTKRQETQSAEEAKGQEEQQGGKQTEIGTQGTQPEQVDLSNVDSSKIVEYLKHQTGIEINSLDDIKELNEKANKEPDNQFVSDEIKAINDFVKDTNRSPQDYFEANRDWDKVAQDNPQYVVQKYLQEQYPDLDQEDIKAEMQEKYLPLEELDPEEYDQSEVDKRKRENKKRQIEFKKMLNESKTHFNQLKEQYKAPVQSSEQKEQEKVSTANKEFQENMSKVLDSDIQDLKFETEQGEFSHKIEDTENLKKSMTSIEGVMDMFRDDNKNFNYKKFAETLITGMKANDIVKNVSNNVASKTKEEVLNEVSPGRQGSPTDKSQGETGEKSDKQKHTERNLNNILGKHRGRKIK